MSIYAPPGVERREASYDPYRHLASAVLAQAIKDASAPLFRGKRRVYDTQRKRWITQVEVNSRVKMALEFLTTEDILLGLWCAAAGMTQASMIEHARRMFRSSLRKLDALKPKLLYVA